MNLNTRFYGFYTPHAATQHPQDFLTAAFYLTSKDRFYTRAQVGARVPAALPLPAAASLGPANDVTACCPLLPAGALQHDVTASHPVPSTGIVRDRPFFVTHPPCFHVPPGVPAGVVCGGRQGPRGPAGACCLQAPGALD